MKKIIRVIMIMLLVPVMMLSSMGIHASGTIAGTEDSVKWKQTDKRWNKIYSANWAKGCALTAAAIQIANSGLVEVDESAAKLDLNTMTGFNPGTLAKAMKIKSGMSVGDWDFSDVISGFKVTNDNKYYKHSSWGWNYLPAGSKQDIVDGFTYFLNRGYFPIVEGPGSRWDEDRSSCHYVAVVRTTENDVYVIDPADGEEKSLFAVNVGGGQWNVTNLEKCGIPKGYMCCRLYEADSRKILNKDYYNMTESQYLKQCDILPSNIRVKINGTGYIKSLPCSVKTNVHSSDLGKIRAGETYTVTAVVKNSAQNYWYRLKLSDGSTGYIFSEYADYAGNIKETIALSGTFDTASYGRAKTIDVTLKSQSRMSRIEASVTDSNGSRQSASVDLNSTSFSCKGTALDNNLKFKKLSKGTASMTYRVTVYGYYAVDGKTVKKYTDTIETGFRFQVR